MNDQNQSNLENQKNRDNQTFQNDRTADKLSETENKKPEQGPPVSIPSRTSRNLAIAAIVILAAVVLWGITRNGTHNTHAEDEHAGHQGHITDNSQDISKHDHSTHQNPEGSAMTNSRSLADIVASARGWGPVSTKWYGKEAPDFTLKDLDGKEHRLSDYRGKNVMLVFWATWCVYCTMEVPHLRALDNIINKNGYPMKILSISDYNETEQQTRIFAEKNKMNYTVLLNKAYLPRPFVVDSLPTSFFIDPEGKIKMATSGMLTLGDMKGLLEAKR